MSSSEKRSSVMSQAADDDANYLTLICSYLGSLGQYRDVAPLGDGLAGTFSYTLRAIENTTGEAVVLKFLRPAYSGYRAAAFRREVEVGQQLAGRANVIQLRSGLEQIRIPVRIDGLPGVIGLPFEFYALAKASGSFSDYLLRPKPPSVRRRLEIVRDLAKGLNRIHRAGYCHRDIQPENVLLTHGGIGNVSDFGTCRLLDGADQPILGDYEHPVGHSGYTAPELFFGGWNRRELFCAADWFSVGAVLFEALCGVNLNVTIKLANDLPGVLQTFQQLSEADRVHAFESRVRDIAGIYPLPSIREFISSQEHLQCSGDRALLAFDTVTHGLCHFDYHRRVVDFSTILRRLDIAIACSVIDERRSATKALRGSPPMAAIVGEVLKAGVVI